ncbi:hypothetical protein MMC11_006112 [Xylographa trunciseda]|nr:hypothetical protein [Xylographa trunciseda]
MSQLPWAHTLYHQTFTLHRLSPLHHPIAQPLLAQDILLAHSRRLKDALKGDVLRGVRVEPHKQAEFAALSLLKSCRWLPLPSETASQVDSQESPGFGGIQIELKYDTSTYTAFLLRLVTTRHVEIPGETRLPLLLTRMPSTVRDVLLDYLTHTFDVRIEPLRLSSQFMGDTLDSCLEAARPQEIHHFEMQVKAIQLVLGFKAPITPGLRNLVVDIRKEDVLEFLSRGKAIIRVPKVDSGPCGRGPFMSSIRDYLQDQTALDINHGLVTISRWTCGAFFLAADGKVKIGPPVAVTIPEDEAVNIRPNQQSNIFLLEQLLVKAEEGLH